MFSEFVDEYCLQLFDKGHLTDLHGCKVDFLDVIVGMTARLPCCTPGVIWIGSSGRDIKDRNDIVILQNHKAEATDEETWDDEEFLLKDGRHTHG